MYNINIQTYIPYLKGFSLNYKYLKDANSKGVYAELDNGDINIATKKEYTNKAFESGITNLEIIKAEVLVDVFEQFMKKVDSGEITKPKTILEQIIKIFTKIR